MPPALRTGFTTGSAAAAAAKAAALVLLEEASPTEVDVPLPAGGRLRIPVARLLRTADTAEAVVIKDAGDDPDATHGAHIHAQLTWDPTGTEVLIHGGPGVGRVTRPGLVLPVGEAAINPAPRRQIAAAVREVLPYGGVHVTISVENGEAIAQKTMNPRLGILGGISILGTRGTVKPFSHGAWRATIRAELAVARAAGAKQVLYATGGRSERFFRAHFPAPASAVQVADHVAFALREAARQGFTHVHWALFLGKLLKQAQGMPCTHARFGAVDLGLLARLARERGINLPLSSAPTALAASDMLRGHAHAPELYRALMVQAARHARDFARAPLELTYSLFALDGTLLCQWSTP
ncbi:MAG TPA: cobalt-precorrin-6A synthase [Desulfomicrobiaceae bacterium]|nr:cobalt-precorrin-6A synthase [Desulfomicrobiaceae bacterium]